MSPEFNAVSKWSWEKKPENTVESAFHYDIDMDLNLSLLKLEDQQDLNPKNVVHKREEIRKTVFEVISTKVAPDMAKDMAQVANVEPHKPTEQLTTNADIESSANSAFSTKNNVLSASNKINMKLDVKANRNVNAATAFYNTRGGVADFIADGIIHNIKSVFAQDHSSEKRESKTSFEGDKVTAYESLKKAA